MRNRFVTALLALAALAGLRAHAPQRNTTENTTMIRRFLAVLLALLALTTVSARAQVASLSSTELSPDALATMPRGNFPDCAAPLSSVPIPSAPHGLFVAIFPHGTLNDRADHILLHNPVVCGANFYIVWSESDRGPGANPRYDFSAMDRQIAPWVAAGKVVNFVVWPTSDSHAVVATPDYVMSRASTVTCQKFDRVPVFWDKNFMEPYKQFMAAVAEKYGNDPHIGYIRFGLASGGETFPACQFALMKEKGLTQALWKDYIFKMLDYEHSLHTAQPLMVGINSFGEPPDLRLPREVAEKAAQLGIGIGSQGMQKAAEDDYRAGRPCDVDWCRIFDQVAGKIPLELQPFKPNQFNMTEAIQFAMERKAQIFEIALPDWIVAYDPSVRGAQDHRGDYIQAFEAAARVLGGH